MDCPIRIAIAALALMLLASAVAQTVPRGAGDGAVTTYGSNGALEVELPLERAQRVDQLFQRRTVRQGGR